MMDLVTSETINHQSQLRAGHFDLEGLADLLGCVSGCLADSDARDLVGTATSIRGASALHQSMGNNSAPPRPAISSTSGSAKAAGFFVHPRRPVRRADGSE
ncbi:hypothetical protein [Mycobacterium intracellulare]|uniref:Uncharacterized protein n=1 Tax=Mycobacterium intracellulare subsp. chimaera TaxID=222805 RepID=A0ABT7P8W5_MYCIT|nr:hypothetical protein [Mycobacterium intracellulare]MDM3929498.1 hypothetical protein [Mycobacterium intracellulare subsp. chimaera]